MARRRISSVIDQQLSLRELFRVRFGDHKGEKRPGKPLLLPRVTSIDQEAIEQVAEVYGGEVQPWKPDEKGPQQWEVHVTNPRGVAIGVVPGFEPWSSAYEQWAGGINTVRCDGAAMQFRSRGRWVERACICAERAAAAAEAGDSYERQCSLTTRLTFAILGIEKLGLARVDTKSFFASQEVPATLTLLRDAERAGWIRVEPRSRQVMVWDKKEQSDKPQTRRFNVIIIDTDFMPDEVLRLGRPESMAQLPAPRTPALGRGDRPQLGPGASIEPVGPQFHDRLPPPPTDIEPVDLDGEDALTGEVVDEADDPAAADAARKAAVQEALPLEHRSAPGDA